MKKKMKSVCALIIVSFVFFVSKRYKGWEAV